MGRFQDKVALVTGAARGQGREHAVSLAREGADVALVDICAQLRSVEYEMATRTDLDETARLVEATGRRALPIVCDVRDATAVHDAVTSTVAELGGLDHVIANAGILPTTGQPSKLLDAWRDAIDTMLSGVYYTLAAATEAMLGRGTPGSIVVTGSTSSLRGSAYDSETLNPGQVGYGAAKAGVLGVVRNFAMALGPRGIRINAVAPMGVRTPMVVNGFFRDQHSSPPPGWMANAMNVDLIEPEDVTAAVLFLLSPDARHITGVLLPVDSGLLLV